MLKCCFYIVVGFFDGDDDDGFQLLISIVVFFRVFIVKSRVLSVRLMMLGIRRWFGIVGLLNLSFVLFKKINAWVLIGDDEK